MDEDDFMLDVSDFVNERDSYGEYDLEGDDGFPEDER